MESWKNTVVAGNVVAKEDITGHVWKIRLLEERKAKLGCEWWKKLSIVGRGIDNMMSWLWIWHQMCWSCVLHDADGSVGSACCLPLFSCFDVLRIVAFLQRHFVFC